MMAAQVISSAAIISSLMFIGRTDAELLTSSHHRTRQLWVKPCQARRRSETHGSSAMSKKGSACEAGLYYRKPGALAQSLMVMLIATSQSFFGGTGTRTPVSCCTTQRETGCCGAGAI